MKIRNGFVSNSSSSSFILTKDENTRDITIDELVERLNNNENPRDFVIISTIGVLYEGIEAFELTPDFAEIIKNFTDRFLENGKSRIEHIFYKLVDFSSDRRSWESREYGTKEGLSENEELLWVDYSSIGHDTCWGSSDDEHKFFERYFLTDDEYNILEDYNYDTDYNPKRMDMIVYSEKKKFNKETFEEDVRQYDSIGINEDISILDNGGLFLYKKLTAKDMDYLTRNVDLIKDGLYFYRDLAVIKNGQSFKAQESKSYCIAQIRGIVEKTKKIELFTRKEDDEE